MNTLSFQQDVLCFLIKKNLNSFKLPLWKILCFIWSIPYWGSWKKNSVSWVIQAFKIFLRHEVPWSIPVLFLIKIILYSNVGNHHLLLLWCKNLGTASTSDLKNCFSHIFFGISLLHLKRPLWANKPCWHFQSHSSPG